MEAAFRRDGCHPGRRPGADANYSDRLLECRLMADRIRGYAHRVDIAGEVPATWRALTDVTHLRRWCAPDAQMRPRAGGLFRASVDRVTEMEAHIDVYEAERRLRLIYLPSATLPATETAIVADFILEPAPPPAGGTIIRVLGSGIPEGLAWDVQFKRMKVGWAAAMARLKVYVEKQMDPAAAAGTGPAKGAGPNPRGLNPIGPNPIGRRK
jgi:uncharacterized protein YndB with AHSA1/START domain